MSAISVSPKVSIILPTYNRGEYIIETIQSVREQTYQNWELLVIDDRSDDNTEVLIKQIDDVRIRYYKTGKRLGITSTRYEGLRKVEGELIAFIDSDDLWSPVKLEKQLMALREYPEADFSLTGGYNFRRPNEPLEYFYKQREGVKYGNMLIPFFKSEASATMPTLIMKKECLQAVNDSEEKDSIYFILSLATQYNAVILYEPLLYRRLHDTNYSSLNRVKRHYDGIKLIKSYRKLLPRDVARDCLFRSYLNFGEDHLRHKERGKAIVQFIRGWGFKPFSFIPAKKIGKAVLQYFIR